MKEVLLCFIQKMNMGAGILSELFHREKTHYDLSRHPRKKKLWAICWMLFLAVWEGVKRFAVIYLLVLLPVSLPRTMVESYRIENFLCLLWFIQFLGGAAAPLGSRHREETATLRAQVFWERAKDIVYMPFVLYAMTYSTGFTLFDCFVMAVCLVMTRLIMEILFLAISRKWYLTKRGEDVVYYGTGLIFWAIGYLLLITGMGGIIGIALHHPAMLALLALGGCAAGWRIYKYE